MSNTFSPTYRGPQETLNQRDLTLPLGSSVTVIGAGAFGGWSALHLLRAGYQVRLVDSWGPGNSRASSGGESRLIRCIYGTNPFYSAMAIRALEIWQEEQQNFERQVFYHTGCLWFADAVSTDTLDAALPILDELNLHYEVIDKQLGAKRYPQINMDDLTQMIYEEQSGYLLAREACREVQKCFIKEGGTYVEAHAEIERDGALNRVDVRLSNGDIITGDQMLFACGPWLKDLFPDVLQEHLKITKQEVYYFGIPKGHEDISTLPTWIDHCPPDHYYGVPGSQNRGFKIAFDRRGPEVDPTTQERQATPAEVAHARKYVSNRFPAMAGAPLLESRVCQYSNTPDANFFFDRHPAYTNVLMLGGGSGHGYKHGPALGELVKDVLTGSKNLPAELSLP